MDDVWRNSDGEGATHLNEVLKVCVCILIGLSLEWVGLHHVD